MKHSSGHTGFILLWDGSETLYIQSNPFSHSLQGSCCLEIGRSYWSLWGLFKELAEEHTGLDLETIQMYDEELREKGPEPRHHSAEYREAYYPAYRVVRRRLYEEHMII